MSLVSVKDSQDEEKLGRYIINEAAYMADKAIAGEIAKTAGRIVDLQDEKQSIYDDYISAIKILDQEITSCRMEIEKLKQKALRMYDILECDKPIDVEMDVNDDEGTEQ